MKQNFIKTENIHCIQEKQAGYAEKLGTVFFGINTVPSGFYADQNHVKNLMRDARLARIFACIYSWISL